MGSQGKLDVEVEVKCHADKFWESLRDSTIIFPKVFPNQYKSIEVLEGDGKSAGSIRLVTYGEESPLVKISKEKVEMVDEEKRTVSYSVIEGDLLKFYKNFKATLIVTAKGDGSKVKWTCEYEKASQEIPDPNIIKEFAEKNFIELDEYLRKA